MESEKEKQGEGPRVVRERFLIQNWIFLEARRPEREDRDLLIGKRRSAVPWTPYSVLLGLGEST